MKRLGDLSLLKLFSSSTQKQDASQRHKQRGNLGGGELAEMGFSPSPHPYPTLVSFKNKSRAPSTVSALPHPRHQSTAEGHTPTRMLPGSLVPKKPRGPSSPADTFV